MKRKHKRLSFVLVAMALLIASAFLMMFAFRDNIVFFYSPTDVVEKGLKADQRVRVGGLVEEGSVEKSGAIAKFNVTDLANAVPVSYKGILPDLFREGQGVVIEGKYDGTVFVADEVLAKHDENYMPPEVADSLKASGKWEEMSDKMKQEGHVAKDGKQPTVPAVTPKGDK